MRRAAPFCEVASRSGLPACLFRRKNLQKGTDKLHCEATSQKDAAPPT